MVHLVAYSPLKSASSEKILVTPMIVGPLVNLLWLIKMMLAFKDSHFYSASALLAMQSAVLARGIPSVRPSVRLSVRHVPVLCPDE